MPQEKMLQSTCSIARSLGVLGERWTLLILREAIGGMTRFADFRETLNVSSDVLAERLATLVRHGVMAKEPYREPGSRVRDAYLLTDAGREMHVVLGALQMWGDKHLPCADGPSIQRRARESGDPVRVGFLDTAGREIPINQVDVIRRY